MAIYPKDILSVIKTELSGSSDLSYVDVFSIRKYYPNNIPDFINYCIIVSPRSVRSYMYEAQQRFFQVDVELILLGKIRDRSEEDIIVANSPGGSPPNVGIATMYEDVYKTLYYNDMSGQLELLPRAEELDNEALFNILEAERDTFLIEARMMYRPRGLKWVGNSAP